ncbi:hypothetical protein TRFO_11966 [Tritrichomonas foetus]|uniref:Uncharacterized protein n=1 Tax=Tritrichomonas foetus TaxID=1144522 RepID=A0A1J4J4T9_9EUKA|nr:hypothetical protein TRFO_11966 [Tritrichomonas foetus]|eukprot:OHS93159.1 hypothetical protein TRFO_11966 [Tritrichomonas foetus]
MNSFSFNTPRNYSPSNLSNSGSPKAADLQIRLERTQKLLEDSQKQQKQLQQELQTIRREYKDLQLQQSLNLGSPSKTYEIQNLNDKLSEKDSMIAQLKEAYQAVPIESLYSEFLSFAQYAQTAQRKFAESRALSETKKEKLMQSTRQFQQIGTKESNMKIKVSSFFDELHTFCDIFIDSLIEKDIPSGSISDDADGSISKALHDSEMQKLKLQNQLYRVQRRFDEENEQSQTLAEQLKNEHLKIAQFTTKMFQNSPIFDDNKFIEKELDIIFNQIALRDTKVQECLNNVQNYTSMISEFLESNGIYESVNDDEVMKFKRLLNSVKDNISQNETMLQNIRNQLYLTDEDPPQKIISELNRYIKCESDLQRLKNDYENLQNENDELSGKVEMLQFQVSELTNQNSETTDHFNSLSLKVKQLRNRISELESTNTHLLNEKTKLDMKTSSLDTQNQLLERQKNVVESSLAHSTQELTKANEDTQKMKLTIDDLTMRNKELAQKVDFTNSQNDELSNRSAKLSDSYKTLSNEYQTLSQSHDEIMNEVKEKRQTVASLTKSLNVATNQISDLKNKLNQLQIENNRLQVYESQSNHLSQENQTFQEEIDKKDLELTQLRLIKDEFSRKKEEYQKLQQSVDGIITAYQEEKEKNKILTRKAKEAEFLREKTIQFEQQISKLSTELATCQRLKKLVEQYEATINSLSTQSDNLQGQIEIISSNHADAQGRILSLSSEQTTLQRKYKDLKLLEKQEKAQLAKSRAEFSKTTNENLKLTNQLNLLQTENDTLKTSVKSLTTQNEYLTEISQKYDKLVQSTEMLTEKSNTLSEGLKTYEVQNKSLKKQIESQNMMISQLKGQIKDYENDKRGLSIELENRKTVFHTAKQIEKENASLKIDTQSKDSKIVELQTYQMQLSSQLETKNVIINNLTQQVTDLKATTTELNDQLVSIKDKLNQLKIQNNSLKSQVNTKSLIIQNYESKIDHNIHLSMNDTEKYKSLQIENLRLKETAKNNDSVYRQVEEFRNANQILTATVAKLEAKVEKLNQINASLTTQIDLKERLVENAERSLKEMKVVNANLSSSLDKNSLRISELEMQTTVASSELLSKSTIEKENFALKQKNREIESKNLKLKADVSQMKNQLSKLIHDNENLLKKIDNTTLKFEQIQTENRQLKSDLKLKMLPEKSDLIRQKDATINQLRSLVASQETSINELEKEANQVSEMKRKYDNGMLLKLMNQIESYLSEFPIDRDFSDSDQSLPSKLRNISSMIYKVKNLYEDQERSIERLTSMQKAQHDTILRMTGSRSPRSPK